MEGLQVTSPPGYPVQDRKAERTETRVMFLGGPLDHAIRSVPADTIRRDRPVSETYKHSPMLDRHAKGPELTYQLTQFISGPWKWWSYILAGHEPPLSHVIDSNPYPFYKQ